MLETVRAFRTSSGSLLLSSEQREVTKLQIMGVNKISFGFQYDLSSHTVEKGLQERSSMLQSDSWEAAVEALGREGTGVHG